MNEYKYKHFRNDEQWYSDPKFGFTVCTQYLQKERLLFIGYAVHNIKDGHFIKRIGNEIALQRCQEQLLQTEVCPPITGLISHFQLTWLALFEINLDIHRETNTVGVSFNDSIKKQVTILTELAQFEFQRYLERESSVQIGRYLNSCKNIMESKYAIWQTITR
jgi:hypothetical protein